MEEKKKFLIAGLGNPGRSYEKTRHNVGYEVLRAYAKKNDVYLRISMKHKGKIAQIQKKEGKIFLLQPTTYMNLSGQAVFSLTNFYKISPKNVLIIVDDVDIPLGEFRIKKEGGTGGHKGLISVEENLGTQAYSRLRVGVGGRKLGQIASHVLGSFTTKEKKQLPEIFNNASIIIDLWLKEGMVAAMNIANIRQKKTQEEK